MKIAFLVSALAVSGVPLPSMEGAHLKPGTSCYSIMAGDRVVGTTLQTITRARIKGRPVWDITVHQAAANGTFDMRDHFVVERDSLLPIAMESTRDGDAGTPGWHRIALTYGKDRVTGTRQTAEGTARIDATLDGPTWDGNLWGVTFAALPLRMHGYYRLPIWQYDKGRGTFTVRVIGEEASNERTGMPAVWLVDAGDDPDHPLHYTIAKKPRREVGYSQGMHAQQPGSGCE